MQAIVQTCEQCRDGRVDRLEPVSQPLPVELSGGRTLHIETHYRCTHCGAKWLHIVENGASGYADLIHAEP